MQAVELRNTSECPLDSVRELFQAANLPFAKDGFHLGPHFLNGIEIRAVGWKVQYLHALCLQNFPDGLDMVGTHIVHHNDVAWPKSWEQRLFQILDKVFSRCIVLVCCKRFFLIRTNGRNNRRCPRRIQRGMIHRPLGGGRSLIKAGQIRVDSAFVQKYQVFHHLRRYGFFPLSALFLHIEDGHARLRGVISFSTYSPLR